MLSGLRLEIQSKSYQKATVTLNSFPMCLNWKTKKEKKRRRRYGICIFSSTIMNNLSSRLYPVNQWKRRRDRTLVIGTELFISILNEVLKGYIIKGKVS